MAVPTRHAARLRVLAQVALVAALLASGLTLRAWLSSGAELAEAAQARADGDLEAAIEHYRRAAVWYFPGNARARRALEALLSVGDDARARGDATLALAAFRSVHAATMSARHVVVPHDDLRLEADEAIAALMAEGQVPPVDARRTEQERAEIYLAMLRADRDVLSGWAFVALVGFAAWVASAATFLSRGFDTRGALVPAEARRWGTGVVLGMGLFVLGLALA
jgi:hypothetical protein